jgi:ATP-dependent DNA helicase RecG
MDMTANEVDRALHASIDTVASELLRLPEDQWFERKSARIAPRELAITISAFANAEGGVVVVGLHDGRVEGVRGLADQLNAWRQASMDFINPPARIEVDQAACRLDDGSLDQLLIVRVPPGETVYEMKNGDCYLRVGDESRKLSFAQRQELHYDRGISQFDGLPAGDSRVSDLDEDLLRAYRASAGADGLTFTRLLRARSLTLPDDRVTNAGYLLFAHTPTDRLPQAQVRIVRHRGPVRGTGTGLNIEGDARVEGAIPSAIDEAARIVDSWQPTRRSLSRSGRFEDQPLVPRDAWLEGIVNAVVHRSYSLAGDHVRIEIFPDRIEIESPGRFPGLADPSRPLEISRYARNPRIARVCTDLAITQELGEGIRRMFDEMRQRGLTDPVYTQTQGSVRLVLSGSSRVPAETEARLPRGSISTLNAVRSASHPLGTGDLMELLDLSRPTLVRQLNALKEEGLVEWTGKSPKDPRATWTVPE